MFEFNPKGNGRGTVVASLFAILLGSSLSAAAQTDFIVGTWASGGDKSWKPQCLRVKGRSSST
jgi:hypothetical protein